MALVLAVSNPSDAAKRKPKRAKKKAKVEAVTAGGPTLKYEQFRKQVEFKVEEKREAQLEGLMKLLKLGPKEEEVPDIKFRIAELYFEKSQFAFFRAQEADDKINSAKSPGERDAAKSDKRKWTVEQQKWAKEAVEVYKEIRESFPNYKRMPEVLFALGQSYWNAGKFQDAIGVYRDLIKNFPKSPLIHDAWLAFGEYYFNEKDLQRALKSYERAAVDKKSRVYGFALYKQAWCYYNMAEWQKALSKFRAVVYYSEVVTSLGTQNKISLAREARKDFVKTYAHQGSPSKAKFVIADITGDDSGACKKDECYSLLSQLGNLWFTQGNFDEAAVVYRDLIRLRPDHSRNPWYQSRIVDLVSRSGNKKPVIVESRRLVDLYNALRDKVDKGNADDKTKADYDEARILAESTIRKLAQVWNREAKKTRQKKTYGFARVMYEDYLKLFPKEKYSYELRFQLADLYYKLEKFDLAAQMYEQTVLDQPKGKFVVDAANDNILALEEHIKDERPKKPKLKGQEKAPIHPLRVRLIKACDRYVKFVPPDKAKKLVAVKFKAAKIFYDHNNFEEAIKRFEDIVANHPSAEESEYAANLVVDVYNLRKQWQLLYDTSVRFLGNAELINDREKLTNDLRRFAEYSKFKLIQILEENLKKEDRDLKPVAMAYEEFQAEFPKSENADKALFNASVAWESVGESERANVLRTKLLNEYKESDLRPDVSYHIARSFEERAEYAEAAELFEAFADDYPKDKRSQDAMYNAAVFYAGVGQVKKSTKLREKYLKTYGAEKGKEKEAADIYWSIAQDLDRGGDYRLAAKRYDEFASKFRGDDRFWEALWRQATILRDQLHNRRGAEKIENQIFGTYRARKKKGDAVPPIAADYASRIALDRLEDDYKKYTKLKVSRPNIKNPRKFKQDVAKKAKAREQIVKKYTEIVTGYQQAYSTIGALYRIAVAWDHFVETLTNVPCPRGLNAEVCQEFKQQFETEIDPARQSSFQAYETCVAKSNELNTFTPFSTKCVQALEQRGRYPPLVERKAPFRSSRRGLDVERRALILKTSDAAKRSVGSMESAQKGEDE